MQQPTGYRAFVPEGLPPAPAIRLSGSLQAALSRADQALGRLDGSVQTLPNPDLFVLMYVRKEAVLSSQIEGTQSSLNDLLEAEAKILRAERPQDVEEVINYVGAMNHGLDRLSTLPVSVRLICEIHERLLRGVRGQHCQPGEIRRTQNWIGPGGAGIAEATFVPPPPHMVAGALSELERFLHADDELPTLIKVGLAHAQFETIHPFLDGNGRVGRLLITFLLCERQVLTAPVLYLSHYLKSRRSDYYERLQRVRDAGEWEEWLEFFVSGISEVAEEATQTARNIVTLRESHRALITEKFGRVAGKGCRLLEQLYRRPIVQVKDVKEMLDESYQTANNLVARFVEHGLLVEATDQARNRRFRYFDYIALFS